ncbi:asparagine synthetase B family protein [Thalassotalea sp. HSM 43]|uniref:asparagine synthase-related protein n=1 Tax=Thalassotalea sp. HSM 43 TaxID=2552945 RepID=UPI0010817E34|nr:asparagine synthetase B family protein [Thalassotalea sp. HSM 43]QBY04177.1 asparagine synthetase B family protein [Thalassotalea sp. HSM 43]
MFGFNLQLDMNSDPLAWPQSAQVDVADSSQHWLDETLDNGDRLLLFGYFWGCALEELRADMQARQFTKLCNLDGHFCGAIISQGKVYLFVDRYRGKGMYWRQVKQQLQLTSHLQNFPVGDLQFSQQGWQQCTRFRLETWYQGYYLHIDRLPTRSYAVIEKHQQQVSQYDWNHTALSQTNFEQQCQRTEQALFNNLLNAKKQHRKVAILLSGGVDSSLLAAMSKKVFDDCILVSARYNNYPGELAMAAKFAGALKLPHLVVDIDEKDIEQDLTTILKHYRKPLRHYSSLVMMAMLKAIPKQYTGIVYGEAADTVMGSNAVKKAKTRLMLKRRLPKQCAYLIEKLGLAQSGKFKFIREALQSSEKCILLRSFAIQFKQHSLDFWHSQCPESISNMDKIDCVSLAEDGARIGVMNFAIDNEVAQHYDETEAIAELSNRQIISPFMDQQVYNISLSLTDKQYFGGKWAKPILRHLASQYYPRDWLYQQKLGFPVPARQWIKGPLKSLACEAETILDSLHVDYSQLNHDADYEVYWLLVNLHLLARFNGGSYLTDLFSQSRCNNKSTVSSSDDVGINFQRNKERALR